MSPEPRCDHVATANRRQLPGTPARSRSPRSPKTMPEPATMSFTVLETSTSLG